MMGKPFAATLLFVLFAADTTFADSELTLGLIGDVNLNYALPEHVGNNYSYPWGDFLPVLRSIDIPFANHESTAANEVDTKPGLFRFEDPVNFTQTFVKANIQFLMSANNHQFDFGRDGVLRTIHTLENNGVRFGGLGTPEDVRLPKIFEAKGKKLAVFTLVVESCHFLNHTSFDPEACTCGFSPKDPIGGIQCYEANSTMKGMWYYPSITPAAVMDIKSTLKDWTDAHGNEVDVVIVGVHIGPNFEWQPHSDRVAVLHAIGDAGVDIVWGSSSHHLQGMEFYTNEQKKVVPVIYGQGDFLFRHFPGVSDYCPDYAIPCEQFRPELSFLYKISLAFGDSGERDVSVGKIQVLPSIHDEYRVMQATDAGDIGFIMTTFNELSKPMGAQMVWSGGEIVVERLSVKE